MLKLTNRNGVFYITGSIRGKRYRESTGVASRPHAEAMLAKRQSEILDRETFGEKHTVTFAEAVVLYLEHGGEKRFVAPLLGRWGHRRMSEITAAEVSRAAAAFYPGCSAATIDRQLYTPMIAIWRKAALAEMCEMKLFGRPKVVRRPVRPAPESWLVQFTRAAKPRLAAVVLFMSYTAARVSEACRLEWEDVDLIDGSALLRKTKNGHARRVVLPPIVINALQRLPEKDGRVFGFADRWSVNQAIKRTCERAGLTYYSSHKVGRHAFAARMIGLGHSTKLVKEGGGWKDFGIVDRHYGHLARSDVDAAVRAAGCVSSEAGYEHNSRRVPDAYMHVPPMGRQ